MFSFFKDVFLSFIYPNKCVFCEEVIAKHDLICDCCFETIKVDVSLRPLLEFKNGKIIYCVSPFKYASKVREAVCRFKFYGYRNYAEFFSNVIEKEINKNILNIKFDFVSAVPLSSKRQSKRGYNQAEWLAKALSKKLNIPYKETLIKIKDNFPQHELPLNQRMQNIKGVYKPKDKEIIKGKNILLCDDIITTGNTLKECVKILKCHGAKNVSCCTIAYV